MRLTGWSAFAAGGIFAVSIWGGTAAYAADVCSMLSPAEAAAALGVPEVKAGAGPNRCIWTPKEYKAGAGVLTVQIEGANDSAKMTGQGIATSGVGDEAIQTVLASTNSSVLHVRKGRTWFVVNVHGVTPDQAMPMERSVAQAIVAKL